MTTIPEALAIAIMHLQAGRLLESEQICRRILDADPYHAETMHLLGLIASDAGNLELAVALIQRAIELNSNEAAFFNNLGGVFQAQGKLEEAVSSYRRALELKPDFTEAYTNLGNAFLFQGRFKEAVVCHHKSLQLSPDVPEIHANLGAAFRALGTLDEAVACYCRALELKPDNADAYTNLGNALQAHDRIDEANAAHRRALELTPDLSEAHSNLGMALQGQEKLDEAIDCYHAALRLKPDNVVARHNLGTAFLAQRDLGQAMACYAEALKLDASFAEAHFSRSTLLLLLGDFVRGWPEYEWRWGKTDWLNVRSFSQPKWDGSPLGQRTILLHAEQGFGDTIQFVRYAGLVKRHNPEATIIVECQSRLIPLLASCKRVDQIVGQGEQLPPFDVQASLLSLPEIIHTTLETIPANVPYLFADPELVARWKERLRTVGGFRIGINWQGRIEKGEHRKRDIPLEHLATLRQIPSVRLISLQKGADRSQLEQTGIWDPGEDFDGPVGAFMDTAAIMTNVDLVISSDTSVPHVAGALAVPVWVALPYLPNWRWLLDRSDSPWYPTMRLFRQTEAGDWAGAFEEIGAALSERIGR